MPEGAFALPTFVTPDYTYRATGVLRGLSIRFRLGRVDEKGVDGLLPDVRLILNYEIPLL